MKKFCLMITLLLGAFTVSAQSYNTDYINIYNDVSAQNKAAVAISLLTERGVLQGNPDGSFGIHNTLNRAEFVTIAIRLMDNVPSLSQLNCFPDVKEAEWYAPVVCQAKALGLVRGNAVAGVPPAEWLFAPERPVQLEEALKILALVLDVPVTEGESEIWYQPYLQAAQQRSINQFGLEPGHKLTRGEMARLTARFVASREGTLPQFYAAETGQIAVPNQAEAVAEPPSTSSQGQAESASSDSVAVADPVIYDPDSDVRQFNQFLLLGEVTPVLAAAQVFSNSEAILVDDVVITLVSAVSSISSLLVYDDSGRLIGEAYKEDDRSYRLAVKVGQLIVPYRENTSVYVRARLKSFTAGGVSGEQVEVDNFTVIGDGEWSSNRYTKTSSDDFAEFLTARAIITSVSNPGSQREPLIGGADQILGRYQFTGRTGDGTAALRVTDIEFKTSVIGGVTVSEVEIGRQGVAGGQACTVAASTITCSNLADYIGDFEDGPVVIELRGDVTVPANSVKTALGVNINSPGSISAAGSITWTDGSSSFTWVPFNSPVVRGTYFE